MTRPNGCAVIRVVENAADPGSRSYTATAAPGSRLACIVESLSVLGKLHPAQLLMIDPPTFDHVALCLAAHGVQLRAASRMEFAVREVAHD